MNKEELERNNIEMLIRDLEEHSLEYWASTQDEMVQALKHLQKENQQLKERIKRMDEVIKYCDYFTVIMNDDYIAINYIKDIGDRLKGDSNE